MSYSYSERETTATVTQADEYVSFYTCIPKHIRLMQKDERFELVASGGVEGEKWARFRIPAGQWNPVRGAKRTRNLTDEQRQALAERLAATRAKAEA